MTSDCVELKSERVYDPGWRRSMTSSSATTTTPKAVAVTVAVAAAAAAAVAEAAGPQARSKLRRRRGGARPTPPHGVARPAQWKHEHRRSHN
jgi:hypothetical protein